MGRTRFTPTELTLTQSRRPGWYLVEAPLTTSPSTPLDLKASNHPLQCVEVDPVAGPHDQFAVQDTVRGELSCERCLDVGELRGEVVAVARPQVDLAVRADNSGATS